MKTLNLKSLKTAPNLDGIIHEESKLLFDLKDEQRTILYILGRDGPSKEYDLTNKSKIPKDTVRRMLRGRETSSNSLINEGYVVQSLHSMFANVKGKKEYEYLLTVKGFLASFHGPRNWEKLRFEENYLTQKIRDVILKLSNDNEFLANTSILFMKYNVALFMAWQKANKVDLSIIDDLYIYFENWNSTNPLLNTKRFYSTVNKSKPHKSLILIRDDFFVISCVLSTMLVKEKKGNMILQYIRKWVRLAETLRDKTHDSSLPLPSLLQPSPFEGEFVKHERIMNKAGKMLGDSGMNNLKLPVKIPSIFQ